MKIAEETIVHFGTGRRDEKDVKIQLKIEKPGRRCRRSKERQPTKRLPGNLIENWAVKGSVWGTRKR